MPFFYKLSDFFINNDFNKKLLKDIQFTIADFICGCEKHFGKETSIKIFLFKLKDLSIKKHTIEYEYFVSESVNKKYLIDISVPFNEKNIIKTGIMNFNLTSNKLNILKQLLNQWKSGINYNYYYLHISCENNEPNITKNGLLGEKEITNNIRIGNRKNNNVNSNSNNNNVNSNNNNYHPITIITRNPPSSNNNYSNRNAPSSNSNNNYSNNNNNNNRNVIKRKKRRTT